MDDLDNGLPLDWEDPDLFFGTELQGEDFYQDREAIDEFYELEDDVAFEALEAPLPTTLHDLPSSPYPPSLGPDAPLYEQTALDEHGVKVGTILTAAPLKLSSRISVDIPPSTLVVPRYLYQNEDMPAPPERESTAVRSLLEEHNRLPGTDSNANFVEFSLDQFTIYIDATTPDGKQYGNKHYPCEMRPLQHLSIKPHCAQMYVDGVLSVGDRRFFVRQVPFGEFPIGNYDISEPTVGSEMWIRSNMNAKVFSHGGPDVYYRLKEPAPEYRRYHSGFLWVADLAKHVIDYLSEALRKKRRVVFRDFRSNFSQWLTETHGGSEAFSQWRQLYTSTDFGAALVANLEFIYKEAYSVLGHVKVRSIYLWKEIRDYTAYSDNAKKVPSTPVSAISSPLPPSPSPLQNPNKQTSTQIPKTIVTPYINQLFNHLPCGMMMEATKPSAKAEKLRQTISNAYRLEPSPIIHTTAKRLTSQSNPSREAQVGDVISTPRDDDDGNWSREGAAGFDDVDRWFGLVQQVYKLKDGKRSFDVTWIYRPIDTLCGTMKYPWNNELFLSDHCSCKDSDVSKIKEDEVLAIHKVDWGGSSGTDAEFFCRQTYLHEDRRWISFEKKHLRCLHHHDETDNFLYRVGDTLLVCLKSVNMVEPCELAALPDPKGVASFRLLQRRQRLEPHTKAPPNELVYTNEIVSVKASKIHGRCLVRIFQTNEPIPPPYDRNGVGNAFYITHCLTSGQVVPIEDRVPSLRQGFDPNKSFQKLRGFDLFCGGGNFGRGLEEGGAIEMNWANDINVGAIHTYMANTTSTIHPFAGSIDDLQKLALQGKFSSKVPQIGTVDFVSGGSPCPGFSRLTIDKATPAQRKNQSLVAAFASFIDTYRPRFGLLENVMEILQPKGKRGEDVFCQLICALVGLGYQAQVFLLDAWTYGSPQGRSRVFLCFAAPGLKLPEMPLHSHSHYEVKLRRKSLGWLPNRQAMVERLVMPTPFKFVSASEATADLPDIMDGKADCCIKFPDHRLAYSITNYVRNQLNTIPMHPYGMNFRLAWNNGKGVMTEAERKFFRARPKGYVSHARIGRIMHWNQNRVFSVMEVRRAQGFRDHEVILGHPKDQWKVVGNSVAREVSLALGLSFREAWLGSLIDGDEVEPTILNISGQSMKSVPGDVDQELANVMQLDTPPWTESRRSTPSSETLRIDDTPVNRKRGSTLVIELVLSKMSKTHNTQTVAEGRVVSDIQH
ncbi:hypothetical protein EsH8_I_000594 [Colletotrichum jinshuiense]